MLLRLTTRQSCQECMVDILRQYARKHPIDRSHRPKSNTHTYTYTYIYVCSWQIYNKQRLLALEFCVTSRLIRSTWIPGPWCIVNGNILGCRYQPWPNHQDPIIHFTSRTSRQPRCLIRGVVWIMAILKDNVHPCTALRFPHTQVWLPTLQISN